VRASGNSLWVSIEQMSSAQSAPAGPNLFCISCGYNQRGITTNRCPECGQDFTALPPSTSRLPWLHRRHLGLLRAYWRTGDESYAELFWRLVEDWRIQNPPQQGANWKCGQETSLRVMAWCFGLYGFCAATATTAERVVALAQMRPRRPRRRARLRRLRKRTWSRLARGAMRTDVWARRSFEAALAPRPRRITAE